MQGNLIAGLPRGLARDAWWLAATGGDGCGTGPVSGPQGTGPVSGPQGVGPTPRHRVIFALALGALVVLADLMVWQVAAPRVSLVVLVLVLAGVAQAGLGWPAQRRSALIGWGGLGLALLPLVEQVQPLSLAFALIGLLHALGWLVAGSDRMAAQRAALRFLRLGSLQILRDGRALAHLHELTPTRLTWTRAIRDWALPAALFMAFALLFVLANPLLDRWMVALAHWQPGLEFDASRVMFWGGAVLVFWPFLRLAAIRTSLTAPLNDLTVMQVQGAAEWQLPGAYVNARSVLRALVLCNALFALQGGLDLAYLWGGVALPKGLTYAAYAHRGAYPLIVTALLAGAFALVAQPFLGGRPVLRGLLYLWLAQNLLLVVSSILRLDLYVGAYGLTRLRFAAFVWMGLVAAGIVLMAVQLLARHSTGWLWLRAGVMALVTLYACTFVNVAGVVAGHNLARPQLAQDHGYLCRLGDGALPAIRAWEGENRRQICPYRQIAAPQDWREWGFRNARLRLSLKAGDTVYAGDAGDAGDAGVAGDAGRGALWLPAY